MLLPLQVRRFDSIRGQWRTHKLLLARQYPSLSHLGGILAALGCRAGACTKGNAPQRHHAE